MRGRRWIVSVAAATAIVAAIGVVAGAARPDNDYGSGSNGLSLVAWAVQADVFSGVGALIAWRRRGHRVGWLLLAIGALQAISFAASTVMAWGVQTGSLPRNVADWIGTGTFAGTLSLALLGTQLPLRLPDGRCLSPRWRRFSHAALGLAGLAGAGAAVQPGRLDGVPGTRNPLGIAGAEPLGGLFILVILAFFASVASAILRYRGAGAHDRAQLRWVGLGAVGFLGGYAVAMVLLVVFPDASLDGVTEMLFVLAMTALPAAVGVAILRHRLYDIDVVIRRTLVYAALTATLVAAYLATVLAARLVLPDGSDLAVAVSTLAAAAAFAPARRRIQAGMDRRFFRRRYDAALTLAAFQARVRDEVNLDALSEQLCAVVADTVQPAHLSLWLRTPN